MKTYPESRTYPWDALGDRDVQISGKSPASWAKVSIAALRAAPPNTPRHAAWKEVVEALDDLECEYDRHTLKPKQFRKLLVAAAQRNEWWARENPRKTFTARVEGRPDLRRCAKCANVFPNDEFKAPMTEAQKRNYHWHVDLKHTYTSHLCRKCRYKKTRSRREGVRGMAKAGKLPEQVVKLRKRMDNCAHHSKRYLKLNESAHEREAFTDETILFHEMRIKLIEEARRKLDGMLIHAESKYPESWGDLLSKEQQRELKALFDQGPMREGGRGATPRCF